MEDLFIHVDEYITDRHHADKGFERALKEAFKRKAKGLHFGEGSYIMNDYHTIKTLSAAHDDGQGNLTEKDVQMRIDTHGSFQLKGTKGEDGKPATRILGMNHGKPDSLLPTLLWVENLDAFTVEDIAFGRFYKSVGTVEVTSVENGAIHAVMEEGLPIHENMGAYCMNRFDLLTRRLLGESLTYGFDYDNRWKRVGEKSLVLKDPVLSGSLKKGDGLSFHQSGRTDFLLFFGQIKNFNLKNVRILDSNGFCMLTEHCGDIKADQLEIRPEPPAFFTGPRDGWKIYRCYGDISLSNLIVEGVRMDGQNVQSTFMTVEKVLDDDEILISSKYAPTPLEVGSLLEFQRKAEASYAKILSWKIIDREMDDSSISDFHRFGQGVSDRSNYKNIYQVKLKLSEEPSIEEGMRIIPQCWVPKSYSVSDSIFRNIAGAGQLLRARNIKIVHCLYEDMMNAGILLGAELDVHSEGPHAEDVVIKDCTFVRCGTKPRYGHKGKGGISIASQGFSFPVNRRILISNNHFSKCDTAIEIYDAEMVHLSENTYHEVTNPVVVDQASTRDITIKK